MPNVPAKTGRPLSFDKDAALRRAMHLFWQQGYQATSMTDLTAAMGINAPSLYNAFGGKEQLYVAALDLYMAESSADGERVMAGAATAREAVLRLLELRARQQAGASTSAATAATPPPSPPLGCMLIASANNGSAAPASVRQHVAYFERRNEEFLAARIEQGLRDGDVPTGTDPAALASYIAAILSGMATLARGGASLERLQAVAALAITAWPGN